MTLQVITCTDFRCLQSAELEPDPGYNLIYGANASGKTSILEAIAYLGLGKSFRGASTADLIRHGKEEFTLFGKADIADRAVSLGVRNGRSGLEIQVDNERAGSAAALAERLPVQVIDPDVHNLVAGGPELRRRYVDWVAFHVEHGYLDAWRRFRRALKQRNAALKDGADRQTLASWDHEFIESGSAIDEARTRLCEIIQPAVEDLGDQLLGGGVTIDYRQGWAVDKSLADALVESHARDLQFGSTQVGPHRADLRLNFSEHQARKRVSRGQQKLLACALVLSAVEVVQTSREKPLLLLLDDPAAELDTESLTRLTAAVAVLGSQVIATSLRPVETLFPERPKLFHVEQGVLSAVK